MSNRIDEDGRRTGRPRELRGAFASQTSWHPRRLGDRIPGGGRGLAAGVIGGPVPWASQWERRRLPAIFIVSTVIILLFAVGFTALTPYVPDAGAFYPTSARAWAG
jgi:hypothetical protein